jgi:hypothetical protein
LLQSDEPSEALDRYLGQSADEDPWSTEIARATKSHSEEMDSRNEPTSDVESDNSDGSWGVISEQST